MNFVLKLGLVDKANASDTQSTINVSGVPTSDGQVVGEDVKHQMSTLKTSDISPVSIPHAATLSGKPITVMHHLQRNTKDLRKTGNTPAKTNIRRFQVKTHNSSAELSGNQAILHRNAVPRAQAVLTQAKSQVVMSAAQAAQIAVNQTSVQQPRSPNPMNLKSQMNAYTNEKALPQQSFGVPTINPNQRVPQQVNPQCLPKGHVISHKSVAISRQHHAVAPKKALKANISNAQKIEPCAQLQAQNQVQVVQKQGQQVWNDCTVSSVMDSMGVIPSNKLQNLDKTTKDVTILNNVKHVSSLPIQQAQQSPQFHQHFQQSVITQQQIQCPITPHIQRNPVATNMQQTTMTTDAASNNQRVQANPKPQAQQPSSIVVRMGQQKKQAQGAQTANSKLSTMPKNSVKTANQKNTVAKALPRNPNCQTVKIIQQEPNMIISQNTCKPIGCVKTIPAQRLTPKNQPVKMAGIKTSLNTNMNSMKDLTSVSLSAVGQKTIKPLHPQQPGGSNLMAYKNQTVKMKEHAVIPKQLIIGPNHPQIRPHPGQVKAAVPANVPEPRIKPKLENDTLAIKEEKPPQVTQPPPQIMPLPYECLQFVLQDHNYGAPPPRTPPPQSPPIHHKQPPVNGAGNSTATYQHTFNLGQVGTSSTNVEDDAASVISSDIDREVEPEGEETETAPEGEGEDEDSITRCICEFQHDDGYMICCDRCLVWQHVDCMGIDRSNIPDEYLCEVCRPRRIDKIRARALQMRKREEIMNSDISSDTSSTSSADTDVGVNVNAKKRPLQSIPRRKSDPPPPQVRRLVNNNNNVAKRQRRDMQSRQAAVARKKEITKRGPGKKRSKRRICVEEKEEEPVDAWGSNMAPLRQWIEKYEEAVTNHYSPELRARISSIKVNGTHNDLRQSNINATATGKCRLNILSNNLRFLVATTNLPPNTSVVELRGKYMLSTQHRPSHLQGRQHTQRPGPFVFFYQLPRDGTEVCVDTRTYGNDARFIRRSCKPNAEVKHCIEKGTLHLYIVTTTAIEKNAEITIRHDQHDLMLSPNSNSYIVPLVCACNNPKKCQIATLNQTNKKGSNGTFAENTDGRERRRRGRRNTSTEENPPPNPPTCTKTSQPPAPVVTAPPKPAPAPVAPPQKKVVNYNNSTTTTTTNTVRPVIKEEPPVVPPTPESPVLPESPKQESKKDKAKMTREERKMEAIMKAFERLEKAELRKQEVQARNAQRKESGGALSDLEDGGSYNQSKSKHSSDKPLVRRKRRKGRARSTSTSQNSRRAQLTSAESDLTSGDESTSMLSPPLSTQNYSTNRDLPYSMRLPPTTKETNDSTSTNTPGNTGIPSAAGILLALSQSNVSGPSSPSTQSALVKSPTCDSGASSSSQSSTPSTPLSSACLLVAAAVGPLAPGFKFPKTKKVLMNEWLKDPHTQISDITSNLQPTANLETSTHELDTQRTEISHNDHAEFLSQSYATKGLATLVQAVNSVASTSESPQQRKQVATSNVANSISSGSAKKRWLRQAISEECESPNSRPESPPSEMVAPPKKRRIARESLSSDNYTPPTTPTLVLPDTLPSHVANNNEDEFSEHLSSPIREQEVHHDFEQDQIKSETKLKSEDLDELDRLHSLSQSVICIKNEVEDEVDVKQVKPEACSDSSYVDDCVKSEPVEIKKEEDLSISEDVAKDESQLTNLDCPKSDKPPALKLQNNLKKEDIIEKGTVEIIDQNEQDAEMDDLSSPIGVMESDAVLKQRVAEMRLEFAGGVAEIVNISSETEKSDEGKKEEAEDLDDSMSIDEYDVEAQMKKITGDDGNDYKEKIYTATERDKNVDGIEGLMESSKEDSESEDREMDELSECNDNLADLEEPLEEPNSSSKRDSIDSTAQIVDSDKEPVPEEDELVTELQNQTLDEVPVENVPSPKNDSVEKEISCSKVESTTELIEKELNDSSAPCEQSFKSSTSTDTEEMVEDPSKVFPSILPLSERIRKKTEQSSTPNLQLEYAAAVIESSINTEMEDDSLKEKSILSTAFRELLEAKLDDESADIVNKIDNDTTESDAQSDNKALGDVQPLKSGTKVGSNSTVSEEVAVENKRKDPRTATPNKPFPSSSKVEPPVKRKLSISEYRKRKQQSPGTLQDMESSTEPTSEKPGARDRSDSASSGTSSISSDEEKISTTSPSLHTLPLFANPDEDKKGNEEGVIGWSAAPTLVERQRENLTERLKREFGLFLSDDEEERARKQGLTTEAILKSRKMSPSHSIVSDSTAAYSMPQGSQLPPQPYIPPPGSASVLYSQYPNNSPSSQYKKLGTPQPVPYPTILAQPSTTEAAPQFLVPQAPPGSNPYPPQFVAPASPSVAAIPRYPPPGSAPLGVSPVAAPNPTQKSYLSHPPSRS